MAQVSKVAVIINTIQRNTKLLYEQGIICFTEAITKINISAFSPLQYQPSSWSKEFMVPREAPSAHWSDGNTSR